MKINIIITVFLLLTSSLCLSQEVINYGEHLWGEYTFNEDMTFGEGGGPGGGRVDVMVLAFSNASSVPFQLTHNYSVREEMQLVPYSEVGTIQSGPEENLYFVYFESADERQTLQFLEDENGYHLEIDEMEYFTMKKGLNNNDESLNPLTGKDSVSVIIKDAYCSEVCYLTLAIEGDERTVLLDITSPDDFIDSDGSISEQYIDRKAIVKTREIEFEGEAQPLITSLRVLNQIEVSQEYKEKDGTEYLVFTFTNTTDEYVQKNVVISYMYYDGNLYHPYKERFSVSLKPYEVYAGNLSYTTRDNKMILAVRAGVNGQMELKNVEVNFE